MRPKFVAGNWKMYTSLASAKGLAANVAHAFGEDKRVMVAVCPPFPWLTAVAEVLKGTSVLLGGQNCYPEREGAFTGEVSPAMLKDAGCQYVIIGHSERRHGLAETDEFLNRKAKVALAAGLKVIFCVGELLAEREANKTETVLDTQLTAGLAGLTAEQMSKVVIAYEPVWAIGTGQVASPEQAQEVCAALREVVAAKLGADAAARTRVLYGGSVKAANIASFMREPDVDGALVGGASLVVDEFAAIIRFQKHVGV